MTHDIFRSLEFPSKIIKVIKLMDLFPQFLMHRLQIHTVKPDELAVKVCFTSNAYTHWSVAQLLIVVCRITVVHCFTVFAIGTDEV